MKSEKVIGLLMAVVLLCGCASKRQVTLRPSWQTAQATNCTATLAMDSMSYTVGCSMQVVRDSLIIISIRPMMPLEIARLEITPQEAVAIDKVNHQYTKVQLTKTTPIVPKIRWNDLQTFASGENAQKGDQVTLTYSYEGHPIRLNLTYGDLLYDGIVNIKRLNVEKYTYIATFF